VMENPHTKDGNFAAVLAFIRNWTCRLHPLAANRLPILWQSESPCTYQGRDGIVVGAETLRAMAESSLPDLCYMCWMLKERCCG